MGGEEGGREGGREGERERGQEGGRWINAVYFLTLSHLWDKGGGPYDHPSDGDQLVNVCEREGEGEGEGERVMEGVRQRRGGGENISLEHGLHGNTGATPTFRI